MLDPTTLPVEDVTKIGTGGLGGIGLMALFARLLRGDIRAFKVDQQKTNQLLFLKIDQQRDNLNAHALEDVKVFASRADLTDLRNHIDAQFADQRNFFISLINNKG